MWVADTDYDLLILADLPSGNSVEVTGGPAGTYYQDGDNDDLPKEVCMPRSPKSFVAHLRSSTSNEDTLVSLIFTEEMLLVKPKSSSDTVSANTVLHTLNFSSGVQAFPV